MSGLFGHLMSEIQTDPQREADHSRPKQEQVKRGDLTPRDRKVHRMEIRDREIRFTRQAQRREQTQHTQNKNQRGQTHESFTFVTSIRS